MHRAWTSLGAACLLFQACGTVPIIEQIPVPHVIALPSGTPSRVLILDRVIFDIPKDTVIGEKRRGTLCIGPEDLVWRRSEPLTFREGEYHREFGQIVTAANFRVPDKPTSLFDAPSLSGTELVIAARVPTVKENTCSAIDSFGTGRGMYKGSIKLSVHWEVYSVADRKVVLALDNEGTAVSAEFRLFGDYNYYLEAFGNALRGLLSNDDFRRLVTSPPAPGAGKPVPG
jgi:hypothetical protein